MSKNQNIITSVYSGGETYHVVYEDNIKALINLQKIKVTCALVFVQFAYEITNFRASGFASGCDF